MSTDAAGAPVAPSMTDEHRERLRLGWLHFLRTVIRVERADRGEPIIRLEPRTEGDN